MTRRTLLAAVPLLALLSAAPFSSCTGEVEVPAKPEVVIGLISSRSGGAAAYGEDTWRGAQVALDARGASLPFTPKVVEGDDQSSPADAQRLAVNMINVDHVDVFFGPIISPSAVAVGKLAEEKGIPMVTPSATQDEVVMPEPGKPLAHVTQICFNDGFQGRALARFAFTTKNLKNAAIIFDKSISYSVGLAASFREEFTALGGTIVAEEQYAVGDADFSALITKVAALRGGPQPPDVLFIPGWDENVGPMLRQSGDQWTGLTLLGGDGWPTQKLLELAAGNVGEAYAMAHFSSGQDDPRLKAFVAAYKAKYQGDPSPHAALGFDAMNVILDAAAAAGADPSPTAIDARLREAGTLDLVTGKAEIPAAGGFTRKEGVIVKVEPAGFGFVERIAP